MSILKLLSSQEEHYLNIKKTLKKHRFCIDTSPLGTGKTYTAAMLSKEYPEVHVISTKTIVIKWGEMADKYSLKNIETFTTFNGMKKEFMTETNKLKRKYDNIIGKSLFIVDESQNLKNNSIQTKVFSKIVKQNPSAHFLYISGSPFDKPEHVDQYLKLFGIADPDTSPYMYNHVKGGMIPIYYINAWSWLNKQGFKNKVYETDIEYQKSVLFNQIMSILSVSMEDTKRFQLKVSTYFKELPLEKVEFIHNQDNLVTKLMFLEEAKLDSMLQHAKKSLNQSKKVVLFVNYNKSISYLQEKLADFSPGVITGKVSSEDRKRILRTFAKDDDEMTVIIGNLTVLSTGIDLDDKTGRYPRVGLVSPNLNGVTIFQTLNRFNRIDTMSDAEVILFYIMVEGDTDFDYIDLVDKKLDLLKDILGKGVVENRQGLRKVEAAISPPKYKMSPPTPLPKRKRAVLRYKKAARPRAVRQKKAPVFTKKSSSSNKSIRSMFSDLFE